MERPKSLAKLKQTIINYLSECPGRAASRKTFWNEISQYQNKSVSHKHYGVSKMEKIFSMFNDVLFVTQKIVRLRETVPVHCKKDQNHDFESDDTDDDDESDSSSDSRSRHHNVSQGSLMSWGSGAIDVGDESPRQPCASTPQPPQSSNISCLSGFIPLPGSSGTANSKQKGRKKDELKLAHTRYGNSQSDIPTGAQQASSMPQPGGMGLQQSLYRPYPEQAALQQSFYRPQPGTGNGQSPTMDALVARMPPQQNPHQLGFPQIQSRNATPPGLSGFQQNLPMPQTFSPRMPGQRSAPLPKVENNAPVAPKPKFPAPSLQAGQGQMLPPTAQVAFASPALLTRDSSKSTLTEWPKPRQRTGPPPGTKMTEPPKIKVKSINLQRGARLSVEQVNFEINDCIDVLSGINEHVSMERLEDMLLGKFRVQSFRALNLNNKYYFNQMEAANEHSRLLCKVNAYIQNFVRSRSFCTLYELGECCRDFHKHGEEYDKLRLGPLQKMPVVYDLFKFPVDEYIPEITSIDLLEHLNNFMDRYQKWTTQVQLEEFVEYLEGVYDVQSSFSLGIRFRSLPLAIQTLKKSKRDASASRKTVADEMVCLLLADLRQAFASYRESLLQKSDSSETHQLRLHYSSLDPANAINEILKKYLMLAGVMMAGVPLSKGRKVERFTRSFESFAKHLFDDSLPQVLFHLAVSMSNADVQQTATEFLEQQQQSQMKAHQEMTKQNKPPPSKHTLTDRILTYLNKCLENGALQLSHLKRIEEKVLEDYEIPAFHQFYHSSFLEFLLAEKKIRQALEECGGTLLGSSSASHENSASVIASQRDLVDFLLQSRMAGIVQNEQLAQAVCEQFHVDEVKALGHGNMARLCQAADRSTKSVAKQFNCFFEAAICGKYSCRTRGSGNVGLQGSQSREAAIACLTACPLLEDMSEWSHWPLLFQPQYGSLRDFVSKHGGIQFISIDGGKRTATSDFLALETKPGKFLKLSAQSTQDHFIAALEAEDHLLAAGHLVSLIVSNKGVESTPMALLANHVKTKLNSLHARLSTPGGPPHHGSTDMVDPAVQFVTAMLLRLPLRICLVVANQLLLEPLSHVVGSAKSKVCIAQACQSSSHCLKLEQLGCLLGVQEWMDTMTPRMAFPVHLIQDNQEDDLMEEPVEATDTEEESSVEDDDDSSEKDLEIEEILSEPLVPSKEGEKASEEVEGQEPDMKLGTSQEKDKETSEEESDSDSSDESSSGSSSEESQEVDEEAKGNADLSGSVKKEDLDDRNIIAIEKADGDGGVDDDKAVRKEEDPERELTKEEKCQMIVNLIREKEFGVGIKLTDEIRDLMLKQQQRQGRSLERLSKELYSKDTHFVLELIQNADDNHYNPDVLPAIKFVIDARGVTVMNNEQGFEEINIRALCDVGKSTKSKHNSGYIGQKGIGFKSVFRVTGRPEVHSNGYHIFFDVNSGPMGYILPHWCDAWEANPSWQTQISLPWTKEIVDQIITHAARFNDIRPSLLLFLHRLRKITIENKVENNELCMERKDLENGQVEISHTHGRDRWLVVRKLLDASVISLRAKSGVEVESTEIALAFPINKKEVMLSAKPQHLPVFAFLPLRTFGFRFIIQGDFDVPSSREDVDRDSSWNQWLRSEIPSLFLDAWESFQSLPNLSPIEALVTYLQFVPMDGEVADFFKSVSHHILSQLRAKECLPVLGPSGGIQWKMPSKTIISRDALVREIISPELLKHHLSLYFLHNDVANALDSSQILALGVETITTEHLLLIGQSVAINWNDQGNTDQVIDIAKWMACVYRSLDDFSDNTKLIEKLRNLKIIPLSSGRLVSVEDTTVFLLKEENQTSKSSSRTKKGAASSDHDPIHLLKSDLSLVHGSLTATPDMEINSQVAKLLTKMDVKQVTPHDLIHSHVMPVLESGQWKEKSHKILVSYLVYIKREMDKTAGILDFDRLRSVAPVITNHGVKVPAKENVHFSKAYKNSFDLESTFPGMAWTLVDRAYLPSTASPLDIQTWRTFLTNLGVNDFLCVQKEEVQLEQDKVRSSAWSACAQLWPPSIDGYIIHDFTCEEFFQLATQNNPSQDVLQNLYLCLHKTWDSLYKDFRFTQLRSGSGDILKDTVETSFFIHLKTLSWVPARWMSKDTDSDTDRPSARSEKGCRPPHCLYTPDPAIVALLGDTVEYLDLDTPDARSSFTASIQVKHEVKKETVLNALISWGQREATKAQTPKVFMTQRGHMMNVYKYLNDELSVKESQDLFHEHPVFFIPFFDAHHNENVAGHMMKREEICWHDESGLFTKHSKSLKMYQSPLASVSFMQPFYLRCEEMFHYARLKKSPDVLDCAELLKHLAAVSSLQDQGTLPDALMLMSKIGQMLAIQDEIAAGVPTNEAMLAKAKAEKIKDLLIPCAVFPTKRGKWVSLEEKPMISDSSELEQLFADKPEVHFLRLELPAPQARPIGHKRHHFRHTEDPRSEVDPDAVKDFLSLFETIKPISDCVNTNVITTGFKPCYKGQLYMLNVVPLLQQVLFFLFPDIYEQVKLHKAATFKELKFIQVQKLEVKFELTDRTDIFELREDKCFVEDTMFYFHEKYIDEQSEINREVAKFLSFGDEECCLELRNFLSQAVAILEGKSSESMNDLFSRQRQRIHNLPEDEEMWEVPAPKMPAPLPEAVPVLMDVAPQEEMVYGRALSNPGQSTGSAKEGGEDGGGGDDVMKCWPPRSLVDIPLVGKGKGKDKGTARWPLPEAPDYIKTSRQLPSNVQFETEAAMDSDASSDVNDKTKPRYDRSVSGGSRGGPSQTSRDKGTDPSQEEKQVRDAKSGLPRQNSRPVSGGSVDGVTVAEKGDKAAYETGEKRKRKWGDRSESEQENGKRPNSVEEPLSSQDHDPNDSTSEQQTLIGDAVQNQKVLIVGDGNISNSSGQGHGAEAVPVYDSAKQGADRDKSHIPVSKSLYQPLHFSFTTPVWNDQMADMKYMEVASGSDLIVNQRALPDDSLAKDIGEWGEALVFNYLLKQKKVNPSIVDVIWANEKKETGLPYDIEIVLQSESDDDHYSVFVDVKATVTEDKADFEISLKQIEFAIQNKERYHIFRVYNAGKESVRLVRIDSISDRLVTKSVKLYMRI